MENQKQFEILSVKADVPESEKEMFEIMYSMTGEEAVGNLIGNVKALEKIKGYWEEDILDKMSSPDFETSCPDDYKEVMGRANFLYKSSQEHSLEIALEYLSDFKNDLLKYLEIIDAGLNQEEILARLKDIKVVALDYLRFVAITSRYSTTEPDEKYLGQFIPQGNAVILNTTLINKNARQLATGVYENDYEKIQKEHLMYIARHEFMHAASFREFWDIDTGADDEQYSVSTIRRVGLSTQPVRHVPLRLNLLNEGVTEKLTCDMPELLSMVKNDGHRRESSYWEKGSYSKEVEMVNTLCDLIDWKYLVAAYFSREAFSRLNRELKEKAGLTLNNINDMMRQEPKSMKRVLTMIKSKLPVSKKIKYLFE